MQDKAKPSFVTTNHSVNSFLLIKRKKNRSLTQLHIFLDVSDYERVKEDRDLSTVLAVITVIRGVYGLYCPHSDLVV